MRDWLLGIARGESIEDGNEVAALARLGLLNLNSRTLTEDAQRLVASWEAEGGA